jgi:hypothetical protein
MPINSNHRDYTAWMDDWKDVRNAVLGGRFVRKEGERYLPKPAAMDDNKYNAYKLRAQFFGGTERTVMGLSGLVMRKDAAKEVPPLLEDWLEDVTGDGTTLDGFISTLSQEALITGRYGILVDLPAPSAVPDALIAPELPQWAGYNAEAIINWRVEKVGKELALTLVVLQETVSKIVDDPFVPESVTQYRILKLAPNPDQEAFGEQSNVYLVELWEENKQALGVGAEFTLLQQFIPTRSGVPLDFIPFLFVSNDGISATPRKPPLTALASINYQDYRHSADFEDALYYVSRPTPYVTGFNAKGASLTIGSSTAWIIPSQDAKVGMLEFQGLGLSTHITQMEKNKQAMAVLGSRLLEEQPSTQETATAFQSRTASEHSKLELWVQSWSMALTKAVQITAWWANATDEVRDPNIFIALNGDFVSRKLGPQELTALVAAWQSSAISHDTLYHNLEKGEISVPGIEAEVERERIQLQAPSFGPSEPVEILEDA